MGARLALLLLASAHAQPRLFRWGEAPSGPGDLVWYSAYRLHGNRSVAIAGLGYGAVETLWQQLRTQPRCEFPTAFGGYTAAARVELISDPESRVANPKIALFKTVVLFCDAPTRTPLAPDASAHVRLALGQGEWALIPYFQPVTTPRVHLAACSRVFGASIHVRFVRDWLDHHRRSGVGRFVLHDHADPHGRWGEGRADLREALSGPAATDVQLVPMIGPYRTWAYHQKLAYYDCLLRLHGSASWVLFVDLDEAVWVRGRTFGALLGALPARTTALVLQFAEVLTFACRPDVRLPLLERMTYVQTPALTKMPRKNCVGGKYAVRPLEHVRTQLNTHAPKNRTRPSCVMPGLPVARLNHYHQLEHSGVVSERAMAWVQPRYCEESPRYVPTDAPTFRSRYVHVGPDGTHPALGAAPAVPPDGTGLHWRQ